MADYKEMYLTLFRSMTKIHDEIETAQKTAEEIYLSSNDEPINLQVVKANKDLDNNKK